LGAKFVVVELETYSEMKRALKEVEDANEEK
jgi:hypothetical protein